MNDKTSENYTYQKDEKKPTYEEFLKMTDKERVALLDKVMEEDKKLTDDELAMKYNLGMEDF